MTAGLTANRKSVRCEDCHRLLAYRVRQSDGSHCLFLDDDWHAAGDHYERNWRRLESGRNPARHLRGYRPGDGSARGGLSRTPGGIGLPFPARSARLVCACGATVFLDPAILDARIDNVRPAPETWPTPSRLTRRA